MDPGPRTNGDGNGGLVSWTALAETEKALRHEWRDDLRVTVERRDRQMADLRAEIQAEREARRHAERRVDDLERWRDRYAGPIVVAMAALTILVSVTNLLVVFGIID